MPWLPLAVGVSAAIPIVPAVVVWRGWGGNLALRSIWILLIAGVFCWSMVRRQHLPQAGHVDDFGSGEGSVLFLRSFRSERVPFSQSDAHARRRIPYRQLAFLWSDPNDEFPSFERYLGPALSERIGPVIGLGAPSDRLPPDGPVLRHYASDDDWEKAIEQLVPAVRCIVMLPDVSRALHIELACVRDNGAFKKLFLLTSPYPDTRQPAASRTVARRIPVRLRASRRLLRSEPPHWSLLTEEFARDRFVLPTDDPGPGSVLTFTTEGRARLLVSGASRAEDYVEAIVAALPPTPQPQGDSSR